MWCFFGFKMFQLTSVKLCAFWDPNVASSSQESLHWSKAPEDHPGLRCPLWGWHRLDPNWNHDRWRCVRLSHTVWRTGLDQVIIYLMLLFIELIYHRIGHDRIWQTCCQKLSPAISISLTASSMLESFVGFECKQNQHVSLCLEVDVELENPFAEAQ